MPIQNRQMQFREYEGYLARGASIPEGLVFRSGAVGTAKYLRSAPTTINKGLSGSDSTSDGGAVELQPTEAGAQIRSAGVVISFPDVSAIAIRTPVTVSLTYTDENGKIGASQRVLTFKVQVDDKTGAVAIPFSDADGYPTLARLSKAGTVGATNTLNIPDEKLIIACNQPFTAYTIESASSPFAYAAL
jgi:hypothetical protein